MHKVRLHKHLLFSPLMALALLLAMTGMASAHAKVYKAIPGIGATVAQAPTTVTVFALENINPDPTKSNLFVYAPSGDLVSQGNAKVSLSNPQEMSISIKPDGNGTYIVRWITVSAADGDPDQGAFFFKVQAGATATPTPAPTASNSGTGTTPTTTPTSGGTPIWVPIVVGIIALLVGLAGGWVLGGRRSAASSLGSMRRSVAAQREDENIPSGRP